MNKIVLNKRMKRILLGCIFTLLMLSACTQQENPSETEPFCGISSNESCSSDEDCTTAGCSGQICQSSQAEERITTCEYKECYDEQKYALSCQCKEDTCQWA